MELSITLCKAAFESVNALHLLVSVDFVWHAVAEFFAAMLLPQRHTHTVWLKFWQSVDAFPLGLPSIFLRLFLPMRFS